MENNGNIYVVSNRNVRPGKAGANLFGNDLNKIHNADLNLAKASRKKSGAWKLELLTDSQNPNYEDSTIDQVFRGLANKSVGGDNQDWVFFVHGFRQSLKKNLNKCAEIASYGVNVIAFSWPSNPAPAALLLTRKKYKRAQENARLSVPAFCRTIDKVFHNMSESITGSGINMNMVVHSLGNFLFQEYITRGDNLEYLSMFKNILMNAPDVDNKGHHKWVDSAADHSSLYVTINEHDTTLNKSDWINKNRLGNTVRNLKSEVVCYMDLTNGLGVRRAHRSWNVPATENDAIKQFYNIVFKGGYGEKVSGWRYNEGKNAFTLVNREPVILDSDYSE